MDTDSAERVFRVNRIVVCMASRCLTPGSRFGGILRCRDALFQTLCVLLLVFKTLWFLGMPSVFFGPARGSKEWPMDGPGDF